MRFTHAGIILCLLVTVGCTKIDYVGQEYPPTSYVDVYYAESDITRDYIVMGHVVASGNDFISTNKMQKKLIKKAREVGADAVIITGLERYRTDPETTYTEKTTTSEHDGKTESVTTASSSTKTEEVKEINAVFIRYR